MNARATLAVFLAVFGVYALFPRATAGSSDEGFIFLTTAAIAERGDWQFTGMSDRTVSRFSVLPSLWGVPFYALSSLLAGQTPDRERWLWFGVEIGSCLVMAMTAALFARWLSELGYSNKTAQSTALLFAFGSLAFPYSGTLFSQVFACFLVLATCRCFERGRPVGALIYFALLVAVRAELVLIAVALLMFAGKQKEELARSDQSSAETPEPHSYRLGLGMPAALMGGAFLGGGLTAFVNYLRGDPLVFGAYSGETFTTPLWIGLFGLVFAVGKGLVLFSPLSLAGLFGLGYYAAKRAVPGRMCLLVVTTVLLTSAKWWAWHAAWCLGPRLLLPATPLLFLPIAHWLEHGREQPAWSRRLLGLLIFVSLATSTWAALQPMSEFMQGWDLMITDEAERIFVPHTSPFGVDPLPWAPWLYQLVQREGWAGTTAWLIGGLSAVSLIALLATTHGIWSQWRPKQKEMIWIAASLMALVACEGPDLIDRAIVGGQYRNLKREVQGDAVVYTGRLEAPLRGLYSFFLEPARPVRVLLDDRPLFQSPEMYANAELPARSIPIEISGPPGREPGPLRWSIPGGGRYKQSIPADYLLSATPSFWDRFRIHWRHFGWLIGLPFALFAVNLFCRK